MRIDILRPELEAIINERLQTGAYESVEDVIWQALRDGASSVISNAASEAKDLVEASASLRGLLTDEEFDRLFSRNPSTGRPVDIG
jgi:Arc/MetJ-type ribon-helix-helix transcriptional regulator